MKDKKKGFDPYALACLIIFFVPLLFMGAMYLVENIRMTLNEESLRARLPDSEADYPAVAELLQRIEESPQLGKGHGLENVDFNNLSIGNPIYAYEYIDGRFEKVCFFYPIFEEDKMVTLITLTHIPDIHFVPDSYTFTYFSNYASCTAAFVYDDDYLNVYDGTEFYPLYEYVNTGRSSIEAAEDISALTAELVLNEVAPVAPLEVYP